ncbi:DUF2735 domain-containing protein [Agrobacterium vaccinii]|jgi:hypothetical protein|uniref:DUF2735 domain-containing protein n=1 Tax=Agrobacterium vaccinii TaxID=2735528 RepID=UPI000DD59A62|nr:DUF2735 domain-containing protein [Agrobacterium vaccinii]UHS57308.1 DUF2735 domain-containing protein [Agrobacterium vaccinii]UHS62084.1 DUF2735 domain-containing protein [Agrobacterium vaccinii]
MRSDPNMQSATIYQFPVGGRAGFKGFRHEPVAQVKSVTSPTTYVDFDSWYHQDAISEKPDLDKPHN